MAAENQNTNPIIIEPAASSNPTTPSRLLTPSLNTSSSSNSFDSSRPQSRGSSATSPTEPPSPSPREVEPYELTNIRLPTTSDADPLPPTSPLIANEQARNMTTTSTIQLSARAEGSSHSNGTAWVSSCCPMFSNRRWLEHSLGVFGLVASLVGLLFIGVRTYKLAVISTENSTLDGCTGLIQVSDVNNSVGFGLTSTQAGVTTFESSTQLCKTVMKAGPLSSPYHLGKRTLRSSLALASKWMKGPSKQKCGFPYIGCQPKLAIVTNRSISAPTIVIGTSLALGGLVLIFALRNARSTEIFTSPAFSDIHITRHKDTGPKTVTGQGILEKYNPEDQDHKGIRASQDQDNLMEDTAPLQSTDSSSTTLVDSCNEPRVSLQDSISGEKHEGLVELQMNGHTKAFLKLETGEFFHLKHWKDKYKNTSHFSHSSHRRDNPLSVE